MKQTKYPITNPNSSGQGFSPRAAKHPFFAVVSRFGYTYSHSTNIGAMSGGWHLYHTFKHGKHCVTLIEERDIWETSCGTASGYSWTGKGVTELKAHLKSKAGRYDLEYNAFYHPAHKLAWTGGDTPTVKDWRENLGLRVFTRMFFREDHFDSGVPLDFWACAGTSRLERARILWRRAKLDAWRTIIR